MHKASEVGSGGKRVTSGSGDGARCATKRLKILSMIGGAALLASCASASSDQLQQIHDPIEPFNRAIFAANDVMDQVVLRPVSFVYKKAVPTPVRDVVRNFLRWLKSPVILANDIMQGDFEHAKVTSARFLVNGTMLGIIDAADGLGLPYRQEDFGQTLGVHGTAGGAYLMLPLLGPSNVRDTIGLVVDHFIDPFTYLGEQDFRQVFNISRRVTDAVDFRAENFDQIDDLRSDSLDFYARVRAIYNQQRKSAINNGIVPLDDKMPDLSEDFDRLAPIPEAAVPTNDTTPSNN